MSGWPTPGGPDAAHLRAYKFDLQWFKAFPHRQFRLRPAYAGEVEAVRRRCGQRPIPVIPPGRRVFCAVYKVAELRTRVGYYYARRECDDWDLPDDEIKELCMQGHLGQFKRIEKWAEQ